MKKICPALALHFYIVFLVKTDDLITFPYKQQYSSCWTWFVFCNFSRPITTVFKHLSEAEPTLLPSNTPLHTFKDW